MLPPNGEERRKILRVVETDPERLAAIDRKLEAQDEVLEAQQRELTRLRSEADARTEMIADVKKNTERLDEAIRGNGKEGLNQTVAWIKNKLMELIEKLDDTADFALRMNTGKFRAIARDVAKEEIKLQEASLRSILAEEIQKSNDRPGGWGEFRKSFLLPAIMIVVSTILGAWLSRIIIP